MPTGTHHLDHRAGELIDKGAIGAADDLLSTVDLANWLGVSTQWVEIQRHKGGGPKWVACSTRRVRYRRADVLAWLDERTRQTVERRGRSADPHV
jgi:predicted DNA-binding transcriptional regulator AlpA